MSRKRFEDVEVELGNPLIDVANESGSQIIAASHSDLIALKMDPRISGRSSA